jgi:hypothetical protein
MAQSGHPAMSAICPLLGAKQTSASDCRGQRFGGSFDARKVFDDVVASIIPHIDPLRE